MTGGRLGAPLLAGLLLLTLAGCDGADGSEGPPGPSSPGTVSPGPTSPDTGGPSSPGATETTLTVVSKGGSLRVDVEGLPGGEMVEVLPCAADLVKIDGGPADAMCSFNSDKGIAEETSADGSLSTTVEPERFLKINGHEVLCDSGCVLGVVTDGRTVAAVAPFRLPDGVGMPAAPELAIESWTYDVQENTGNAVVVGTGFQPGADVDLSQCPVATDGAGVDGADCLYEYGTAAVADADGAFRVDVAAFPLFQRTDGERADEYVDCVERPQICAIGAPWVVGERIAVVTFDTAP
ncbi:hypothetical protein GCM10028784_01540 [Myceligenerans cantabricum]